MKRDSFIFYRSFFESISELPDEVQLILFKAISEYSLNFNEIELTGIAKTIFILIKPQLAANNKRFTNGTTLKQKQTISKTEANHKQNISKTEANHKQNRSKTEAKPKQTRSKTEAKPKQNRSKTEANKNVNVNVNDNVNVNVNVNDIDISKIQEKFYQTLIPFVNKFGQKEIRAFYDYWSEPNKSKTKIKFQLERTWDTNLRLLRWCKNNFNEKNKTNNKGFESDTTKAAIESVGRGFVDYTPGT